MIVVDDDWWQSDIEHPCDRRQAIAMMLIVDDDDVADRVTLGTPVIEDKL